ncbi:expressed unknown protein [Seminavis robusta]|uniref:Uncharacterized protein n=1 Tax=Seminavis robusta TaxID=568900 RepID=A0A9N8H8L7_9STRA|nr:expressed unknown protein [Seminavis robusta]|eukprot:Sro221_g091020.1 n/a (2088) ;mRNA; f:49972-56235
MVSPIILEDEDGSSSVEDKEQTAGLASHENGSLEAGKKKKIDLIIPRKPMEVEYQARLDHRERVRQQQREEEQRQAEEQMERTRLQMEELQQQLQTAQSQQEQVIRTLCVPSSKPASSSISDKTPSVARRRRSSQTEVEINDELQSTSSTAKNAAATPMQQLVLENYEELQRIETQQQNESFSQDDDDDEESLGMNDISDPTLTSEGDEGEEDEEEKKESDVIMMRKQQHTTNQDTTPQPPPIRRGRQVPAQTSSQKSNAMPPRRRSTLEDSGTSTMNSVEQWKQKRSQVQQAMGNQNDVPVQPTRRNNSSQNTPPRNVRRKRSSSLTEMDRRNGRHNTTNQKEGDETPKNGFFDWKGHRKTSRGGRNNSLSASDHPEPHSATVLRKPERRHTGDPPDETEMSERTSQFRSLQQCHTLQQGLFEETIDMIQQESESVVAISSVNDPVSQHRRKLEIQPSPVEQTILIPPSQPQHAHEPPVFCTPRELQSMSHTNSDNNTNLSPSPPRRTVNKSLLDMGFGPNNYDFSDDDDEEDEEDQQVRLRRQQNVLHLSSSWNDLFQSSNSSIAAQSQLSIPRRRGSMSSDSDGILQFEPDDDDDDESANNNKQETVQELEQEARPTIHISPLSPGSIKRDNELLHMSGSLTDFFVHDEDDENDDVFDENYNKSLESWRNNQQNNSGEARKNLSDSNINYDSATDLALHLQMQGSGSSNMSMFEFSHSSDDPSKMLSKFQESMSQYTEAGGVNASTLMEHLRKTRGKPAFRWDARGGSKSSDNWGGSSHHGRTTITSNSTSIGSRHGRKAPTNPMRELRKNQQAKRKSEVNPKGQKHQHRSSITKVPDAGNTKDITPDNSKDHHHHHHHHGHNTSNSSTPANNEKPPSRRSRRGSLGEHLQKSNQKLMEVSAEPGESSTVQPALPEATKKSSSPVKKERTRRLPGREENKARPKRISSGEENEQGRRLPRRERRNRPGRTRSRSLSDLQRLRPDTNKANKKNSDRSTEEDDSSATDDPQITKYKSLVGDLVEQEKSSAARKEERDGGEVNKNSSAPNRPNRPYNWANPRSRRRASYDWMKHQDGNAKDNMLALVGQDVLVKDGDDDFPIRTPRRGPLERHRSNSLTNLIIVIHEGWEKEHEDPDYNWKKCKNHDPILTSDSVMHFTGTTPAGALSEMLQEDDGRRQRLTDEPSSSFSSRSSRSVDVAAKKPMRRFTALVQNGAGQIEKEPDLHASYDWDQHNQNPTPKGSSEAHQAESLMEESMLIVNEDGESHFLRSDEEEEEDLVPAAGSRSRASLGAYLSASASANNKSTEAIEKIFDWTAALCKGELDKSTIAGSSDNPSSETSSAMPSSASSVDVAAKKPLRASTMDLSFSDLDVEEAEPAALPSAADGDEPGDKRHSLEEFIGSKSSIMKGVGSVAGQTMDPSIVTGAAVLGSTRSERKTAPDGVASVANENSKGEDDPKASIPEAAKENPDAAVLDAAQTHNAKRDVHGSRDRRSRGVQRTRSRSLTDVGRAGRRSKDEKPRGSRRRASITVNQSAPKDGSGNSRGRDSARPEVRRTRSKSLTKFFEGEKASQTETGQTSTTRSRGSRESMTKSRTSETTAEAERDRNRGRDRDKTRDRRRSRSRSLTDMDSMRQKDAAKGAAKRASMASETQRPRAPDKENRRRSTTSEAERMKRGNKSSGRLSKTTHHARAPNKHSRRTSDRLGTSLHLNLGAVSASSEASASRVRGRENGDRKPELRRRRSSSLSDMEGMDKERHGRRESTTNKEGTGRSGRRNRRGDSMGQSEHVQPRRRRPERQRSRSLTNMDQRDRRGKKREVASGVDGNPQQEGVTTPRPNMLSYDWQQHSASTTSMMSNSSKPQRDRRATLARTRSQSLSSLFGDKSRGHTSDASIEGSTHKGGSAGYNWSQHGRTDETGRTVSSGADGAVSPGPNPRRTRNLRGEGPRSPRKRQDAGYDWNAHVSPTSNKGDDGGVDKRSLLSRSKSRSLTDLGRSIADLDGLITTSIEESPFENSDRSKISADASSNSLAISRSSLNASGIDLQKSITATQAATSLQTATPLSMIISDALGEGSEQTTGDSTTESSK